MRKMLEFLKKLFNKIFGKKSKMLEQAKNVDIQTSNVEENSIDSEDDVDMFGYLTGIMKSCDNYESFKNTKIEINKKREEMKILNEKLKKELSTNDSNNA